METRLLMISGNGEWGRIRTKPPELSKRISNVLRR